MPSSEVHALGRPVSVRLIVTGATDDDGRAMAVRATSARQTGEVPEDPQGWPHDAHLGLHRGPVAGPDVVREDRPGVVLVHEDQPAAQREGDGAVGRRRLELEVDVCRRADDGAAGHGEGQPGDELGRPHVRGVLEGRRRQHVDVAGGVLGQSGREVVEGPHEVLTGEVAQEAALDVRRQHVADRFLQVGLGASRRPRRRRRRWSPAAPPRCPASAPAPPAAPPCTPASDTRSNAAAVRRPARRAAAARVRVMRPMMTDTPAGWLNSPVTLFTGERSNRSTLSRAGWVAPTGPAAKPLSTLSVTLRTTALTRSSSSTSHRFAIAQPHRSVPAVKTPAPDFAE